MSGDPGEAELALGSRLGAPGGPDRTAVDLDC